MIPRTARRRLEKTVLSSRQGLPRPARLLSTPTMKTSAPAAASAAHAPTPDFPFFPQPESTFEKGLASFLHRPTPLTIVPTPTPGMSETPNRWFSDTKSVDMTAIIDACLHNLYDVPRAQDVFARLRTRRSSTLLTTALYNAFLEAYIGMAHKDEHQREYWIKEAWKLYHVMELGTEEVLPNPKTYSIMLLLWHQ